MDCPHCGHSLAILHRKVVHCETWEIRGNRLMFVKTEYDHTISGPQCTNCGKEVWELLKKAGVE